MGYSKYHEKLPREDTVPDREPGVPEDPGTESTAEERVRFPGGITVVRHHPSCADLMTTFPDPVILYLDPDMPPCMIIVMGET